MNGKRDLPFFLWRVCTWLDLLTGIRPYRSSIVSHFLTTEECHSKINENSFELCRKYHETLPWVTHLKTALRPSHVAPAGLSTTVAGTFRTRRLVVEKSFELCRKTSSCLPLGGQTKSAPCGEVLSLSPPAGLEAYSFSTPFRCFGNRNFQNITEKVFDPCPKVKQFTFLVGHSKTALLCGFLVSPQQGSNLRPLA